MRADNIDILKAICAFLIVCLHIPFPGEAGAYFTTLTRRAVPIFFMITGYFYSGTKRQHRELNQIKKMFVLGVEANLLYFVWNIALSVLKGEGVGSYICSALTWKNILKLLLFNETPLAVHLWYLGAILYVLIIVVLTDKLYLTKVLYILTPVLLITDVVLGKYSLLIFHREFPYIFVRNFLCVGIPYFCIGRLINEKKWNLSKEILRALIAVFGLTSMMERFLLVSAGMNATRDHYISTTLLALCLFLYTLESNWKNEKLATIGREYSTWIYILHPIFIILLSVVISKGGLYQVYRFVAPIVVFLSTLIFLIAMEQLKKWWFHIDALK